MAIQDKFNKTGVIYKITSEINLGGGTLTIPNGCTLDFQGGCIKYGTVNGNGCLVQGDTSKCSATLNNVTYFNKGQQNALDAIVVDVDNRMDAFESGVNGSIATIQETANNASSKADSAVSTANAATSTSNQAISTANIAKEAVKTLEGLANATTAMETLAGQVMQIEENKQNIAFNKDETDAKLSELGSGLYGTFAMKNIDSVTNRGIYIREKSEYQTSPSLLFVYNNDAGVISQTILEPSGNCLRKRAYNNGVWSAWEELAEPSVNLKTLYGSYKGQEIDSVRTKGIYIREKSEYQNFPDFLFVSIYNSGVIRQTKLGGGDTPITYRDYNNSTWGEWRDFISEKPSNVRFIASNGVLPNFDTEKGLLDLGDDPIICIGTKIYGKTQIKDESYRRIPLYEAIGYASSTLRVFFNPSTCAFSTYTSDYYDGGSDNVLICTARINKTKKQIISVSAPFDYTIDFHSNKEYINLPYSLIEDSRLRPHEPEKAVFNRGSAHTDYIDISKCSKLFIDTMAWVSIYSTSDNAIILYDKDFSVKRVIGGREFANTTENGKHIARGFAITPSLEETYIRVATEMDDNGGWFMPIVRAICETEDYISKRITASERGNGQYHYYGEKICLAKKRFQAELFMNNLRHPSAATSGQGMTIYGDYLFQGGAGGYINIYDLLTKEVIQMVTLASASLSNDHHCNNLCFGLEQGSELPYLYISEGTGGHRLFVEDIKITSAASALVQTLSLNSTRLPYEKDWVIDTDKGYLYAIGDTADSYYNPLNKVGIAKMRLPKISEGNIEFTDSDILEYFEISGNLLYIYQGSMYFDGKIFIGAGGSAEELDHDICVIDLDAQTIISRIPMNQVYPLGEVEGMAIYNDSLIVAYPNQSRAYRIVL